MIRISRGKLCSHAVIWFLLLACLYSSGHARPVFHVVKRGDTLWGISRSYGVDLGKIRAVNEELARTDVIKPGQRVVVPASVPLVIEPLTRQVSGILGLGVSERWEYIVVHHSATDVGGAARFERHHIRVRGVQSLGYHFVIGNGTDTGDGQIETGSRWRRQLDGAHTQGNANRVGIGICLVGNFENSRPTRRQMDALINLVTHLAYKYDIPLENIKGHGDFDRTTRCPGRNFPWLEFKGELMRRGVR